MSAIIAAEPQRSLNAAVGRNFPVKDFDLVVVGTGSSGTSGGVACAQAGKRVAIVDERPYGGTCALRGCDPKKVLVGAAELIDWARGCAAAALTGKPDRLAGADAFQAHVYRPGAARARSEFAGSGLRNITAPLASSIPRRSKQVRRSCVHATSSLASGARPATLELPGEELLIDEHRFSRSRANAPAYRLYRRRIHRVRVRAPRGSRGRRAGHPATRSSRLDRLRSGASR